MEDYREKFEKHIQSCNFTKLDKTTQEFLKEKAYEYRLSFQDLKQFVDMAIDLDMWEETPLHVKWEDKENKKKTLYM